MYRCGSEGGGRRSNANVCKYDCFLMATKLLIVYRDCAVPPITSTAICSYHYP